MRSLYFFCQENKPGNATKYSFIEKETAKMYTIFRKLEKFRDIQFDETVHAYTINGKRTISVTKLTGTVTPPFNELEAAQNTAKKRQAAGENITPEQVIAEWHMKNKISKEKGTAVHKYIECALASKVEHYPAQHMQSVFGGLDPVKDKYNTCVAHAAKFLSDIRGRLIPVKSEVVVGSEQYLLCGMIDQLFFNEKSGQLEIWDWKTNSEFSTESRFHLLSPVSHLSQSKLDEYSLQLYTYKKIIEMETGLEIGNCYICWFSELQPTYKVFKCRDVSQECDTLLANRLATIGAR